MKVLLAIVLIGILSLLALHSSADKVAIVKEYANKYKSAYERGLPELNKAIAAKENKKKSCKEMEAKEIANIHQEIELAKLLIKKSQGLSETKEKSSINTVLEQLLRKLQGELRMLKERHAQCNREVQQLAQTVEKKKAQLAPFKSSMDKFFGVLDYVKELKEEVASCRSFIPRSCKDFLKTHGASKLPSQATKTIYPDGKNPITVQCDFANGGWTRLVVKTGKNKCSNGYSFDWTPELLKSLQFKDFGVSDSATTMKRKDSFILKGATLRAEEYRENTKTHLRNIDAYLALARTSNCKTLVNTNWSQNFSRGYLRVSGTLNTYGGFNRMWGGCKKYVNVGSKANFRLGGARSHTGEWIHTSCNDYTRDNSVPKVTTRWDWNVVRAIWVR